MTNPLPLYAEIVGDQFAQCCGISVTGASPVLELCRRLVAAGHDPALPLEAYRGDVPALSVRSIGEAAGLQVNSTGTGFEKRRQRHRAAPPVRFDGEPASDSPDTASASVSPSEAA
jgi:hypothetical protein